MRDFVYFEPKTISEAASLLARYKDEAKVIAGGTDLLVDMKHDRLQPKYLINIKAIPGLDYINFDSEGLRIGALATIRALEKSAELQQKYPIISQTAHHFGSIAIRNVATIGGNLCHAVPSADTAPGLIGLSASARIMGNDGDRVVPLDYFFTGSGKTVLKTGELLVEIQVPPMPANTRGVYLKYAIRSKSDLPVVGVAVVATMEPKQGLCRDIKIALGNVAPTPIRACFAEEVIRGQQVTPALIEKCAQAAADEAHPRPGSIRASPEYKKAMVKVFTRKALEEVLA
ncbi:MAG: xanthine dehydrogenase family protein subunit M [Chloroflexota bacterium]|nr:xanthine dehydrogenase family protein subunit M [Chloroflexota bacterium]